MDDGGVRFEVDGREVRVDDDTCSLLDALRGHLGIHSVKDGCSPQGQCGCCTVLVDGSPRVACVTPVGRVRGKVITTVDGLADRDRWAAAFCETGASQCGFCTPGIIVRFSALAPEALADRAAVDKALLAHLCRCTGWQPIREAAGAMSGARSTGELDVTPSTQPRDVEAAARRAALEGGAAQRVSPDVALGRGAFADDTAPPDALVAMRRASGTDGAEPGTDAHPVSFSDPSDLDAWVVGETLVDVRARSGKVQGRRTTAPVVWPVDLPPGEWRWTLQTTWVEPAYLESDASWCVPGGEPASPAGNGGAFGGKADSVMGEAARGLADRNGRPVRTLWAREDVVRLGPKRPPVAVGIAGDGRIAVRVAQPRTPADSAAIRSSIVEAAGRVRSSSEGSDVVIDVEMVPCVGPAVSGGLRGAGWAEVAGVLAATVAAPADPVRVTSATGALASAAIDVDGRVAITIDAGPVLDPIVLRSYCVGAAHQAFGMVRSESISLDDRGRPLDLTIRSFGILRAIDMPEVDIEIRESSALAEPVNGSDAVFAAVFGAAWRAADFPPRLPLSAT